MDTDVNVGRLRLKQRRGLNQMRSWFNTQEVYIRWTTPSLGNIYNDDLVAYMDRMYQYGWVEEDKDALNEIRQLYLINKDNLNRWTMQLILK
jgi:hypothetical protein